jgi:hypothetical protein
VVVGQPGSGKTTFLRRIAFALCQTRLGDVADAADQRLGIRDRTFPVYVRINELAEHVKRSAHAADAPRGEDAAAWLPHYLTAVSAAASWGLDARFFQQQLADGVCTVLLDGLDEAPDRLVREQMSRLISNVTTAYGGCRYVVTSRPVSYTGATVLAAFDEARIDPLSDAAVETFAAPREKRWCGAVYQESASAATAHCDELLAAVRGRAQIRRMARNPVMLTALAVVHWNERRLPEQRADLYDSIITWLSRSREQRAGRETADRTVVLLQELALAMQDDPEGRKTQVSKRWGAEKIAAELAGAPVTKDTVAAAERFLDEEEVDSGIIVGRGNELAYWHLTFQEFLAAKAIASRLDDQQRQILLSDPNKVYLPDWREVVLLYAGALHQQGKAKVAGFLGGLLDGLGPSPSLADQARCAGLIGSISAGLGAAEVRIPRYPLSRSARRGHGHLRPAALPGGAVGRADRRRRCVGPGGRRADRSAARRLLGRDPGRQVPDGRSVGRSQGGELRSRSTYTDQWRETPHEVYLDAYGIARYPVTVGQYRQFVEDEGYQDERWWTAGGFGEYSEPAEWERQVAYPSRPVVGVSWWEAKAFCAWAGVRLATEAEWERAARGTKGRKYPWGNEPSTSSGQTTTAAPTIRRRWASIRWATRRRGFAIWRAMSGSGARMDLPSILPSRRRTRAGIQEARSGCMPGRQLGTTSPGAAGRRTVAGAGPSAGTAAWASASRGQFPHLPGRVPSAVAADGAEADGTEQAVAPSRHAVADDLCLGRGKKKKAKTRVEVRTGWSGTPKP